MCVCGCTCVRGDLRWVFWIFLRHSPPYYFGEGLSQTHSLLMLLVSPAWLLWGIPTLHLPRLDLQPIYMDSEAMNSSPLDFQTSSRNCLATSLALAYFFVSRWSHYVVGCPWIPGLKCLSLPTSTDGRHEPLSPAKRWCLRYYFFRNSLPGNWRGRYFPTGEESGCLNFVLQRTSQNQNREILKRLMWFITAVARLQRVYIGILARDSTQYGEVERKLSTYRREQERAVGLFMTTHSLIQAHRAHPTLKR